MKLTPEQEALKQAAKNVIESKSSWPFYRSAFDKLATPGAVHALLAQIEAMRDCPKQTPYGEAICGVCIEASERDKAS